MVVVVVNHSFHWKEEDVEEDVDHQFHWEVREDVDHQFHWEVWEDVNHHHVEDHHVDGVNEGVLNSTQKTL